MVHTNGRELCWICKKKLGKSASIHHLFNFDDYRLKMMDTFPEKALDKKWRAKLRLNYKHLKDANLILTYKVHHQCHRDLEIKIKKISNQRYGDKKKWCVNHKENAP